MKVSLLIVIIALTLLIPGCFLFSGNNDPTSAELNDAYSILKRANEQYSSNHTSSAEQLFNAAYRKFAKMDNYEGKIKCSIGFVNLYTDRQEDSASVYWLNKLLSLSNTDKRYSQYYIVSLIRYLYSKNKFNEIVNVVSKYDINLFNPLNRAVVNSYVLLAMLELKENISSKQKQIETDATECVDLEQDGELDNPGLLGFVFYTLGFSSFHNNSNVEAFNKLNQALYYDKRYFIATGIADDLFMLGKVSEQTEYISKTAEYFERALDVYKSIGNTLYLDLCSVELMRLRLLNHDDTALPELRMLETRTQYQQVKEKINLLLKK